jgi:hypothetical protein
MKDNTLSETTDQLERRSAETNDPRERRLVLRLLSYWRDVCGDNDMPLPKDIDGSAIPDMWDYSFIINIDGDEGASFESVGDWHVEFHGKPVVGVSVGDVGDNTILGHSTSYLDEVVKRQIPVTYGGEFIDADGNEILYRSILLPLSSDGVNVDAVLGGANCRITAPSVEPEEE